jgi:hypothetical protein
MMAWAKAAISTLFGGQNQAGAAAGSAQPVTAAASSSSAEKATSSAGKASALMSNRESIDLLDPDDAPDQSGAPEVARSDGPMEAISSLGCMMENNGSGGAESSSAEPADVREDGVLSAREQVLLGASDELECLFQRLGVDHFPVLECVCSTWRQAICSARLLSHQYLLYPSEAYPLPRTPGGIVSPSAVCVLPNGELVVTDTGASLLRPRTDTRHAPPVTTRHWRSDTRAIFRARVDPATPCAPTGNDLIRFVNAKTGAVRLVVGRRRAFLSSDLPETTPHVEGEFDNPMGVVADGSGEHVFVADTFKHRLVKLRVADGAQVAAEGAHGIWPMKMIYPQGVAVGLIPPKLYGGGKEGEAVFVCDSDNNRLQVGGAEPYGVARGGGGGWRGAWVRGRWG